MDVGGVGFCGMDWIHLVQVREQWRALVNAAIDIRYWECIECLSDCRRLKKDSVPWS
jgi:hypothetical protein